ncbi:putative WD40 domain containing protein [Rhypophila decipiens]
MPPVPNASLRERASGGSSRTFAFFKAKLPVPEDPLGLTLVHDTSDSDADIIFVHGLGGSSLKTWSWNRDAGNFWPTWIHLEEGLARLRIFTFGYNANFRDSKTTYSILDFSKSLLAYMQAYGSDGANDTAIGGKPIVFVCHSMGGLVVKKALVLGKTNDQYASLLSRVHGIMFLSTPHRGSSHASTLNGLLSLLVGSSKKVYVSELEPSSTSIGDINEQFRGICGSWELVSFYENKVTKLSPGIKRIIVDKNSGILNYPKEISIPLDADHHSICKFQSRLDPNYRLFIDMLGQLMSRVRSSKALVQRLGGINYAAVLEEILGIYDTPQDNLDSHLSQALPESCQWLLGTANFKPWLDSCDRDVNGLWLTGLPGTGKSTLAAKTIDHIQHTFRKSSCQYHFFTETQPATRTTEYALRAIASQLADGHREFADKLIQLHRETGFTAYKQKFRAIWETIFENIVFKMDFGHTLHWVFDGMDEADAPKALVRNLVQIKSHTHIKVLLLSRPRRELTSLVTARFGPASLIQVSSEDTQEDIQDYIASVLGEILPDDDQSLHQHIIQRIRSRADGSFLWTKLALETLRENWHTQAGIEMSLDLPKGMDSLYRQMMGNVCNQNSRLQEMAFRILTWAAYAIRPLNIDELAGALQPEYEGFVNLSETVVQVCGHFVCVDGERVILIHSTARSFLLNTSGFPSDTAGIPSISGQEAGHATLAMTCLQYLSQDHWRRSFSMLSEEQEQIEELAVDNLNLPSFRLSSSFTSSDRLKPLYEQFPLLLYAMNNWAYHVSQASTDNQALCLLLRHFCSNYILQWIQAVALSNKLDILITAAHQLNTWIRGTRRREKSMEVSSLDAKGKSNDEVNPVQEWVVDLIRVVGKFGPNLVESPSSIYKNIPPLCPGSSVISRTYGKSADNTSISPQLLSVSGLSSDTWDDNISRLPVSEDEIASAVRCAGNYFLTLISRNGTIIVWHKETCEEVHRLHHGEWTTILSTDRTGRWAATAGRYSFQVWELETGRRLYKVPKISPARTLSLDFALGSDMTLLVGYDDCTITSYDLEQCMEESLFTDPSLADNPRRSCPRAMSLSPDQKSLAIAFRGLPLALWDIAAVRQQASLNSAPQPGLSPRICIRKGDRDLEVGGQDVFNSPEVIRWQPVDGTILYILYQDATIVVWDLAEDTQMERGDTGAREMVLNHDGTLLLTSNNNGAIRVWSLPTFHLIYELSSDEFVRDLAFSPDSQRIYDIRGSGCNVWAPDILMRLDSLDIRHTSSSGDGTYLSEVVSEPVLAKDQRAQRAHITALVADDEDEFFCVGRDDGAVNIHSMTDGQVVRKAYKHSDTVEITVIEWSLSRRFIASADDSSKVMVKRLRIKEDDKWAVFPMFDLRVGDAVTQLLFSQDETMLLISTESTDRLWDLKAKREVCKRRWAGGLSTGRRWLHHPVNTAQLIWLGASQIRVHTWAGLADEPEDTGALSEEIQVFEDLNPADDSEQDKEAEDTQDPSHTLRPPATRGRSPAPPSPSFTASNPGSTTAMIKRVLQPNSKDYIVYESLPSARHKSSSDLLPFTLNPTTGNTPSLPWSPTGTSNKSQLYLVHPSNLPDGPIYRKPLKALSTQIRHFLGPVRDKLVFIDQENWVCTTSAITSIGMHVDLTGKIASLASSGVNLEGTTGPAGRINSDSGIRRHFFLPRDWVNPMTLQLVTKKGTVLTARNGEVAILRYGKGF